MWQIPFFITADKCRKKFIYFVNTRNLFILTECENQKPPSQRGGTFYGFKENFSWEMASRKKEEYVFSFMRRWETGKAERDRWMTCIFCFNYMQGRGLRRENN